MCLSCICQICSKPSKDIGNLHRSIGLRGKRGYKDAEKKKKSLTAEINNGRLAMMAIIGILVPSKRSEGYWALPI